MNSEEAWHSIEVEDVSRELNTDIAKGLDKVEARRRLEKFGPNELVSEKGFRILDLLIDQFKDVFIIMLIIASVLSYFIAVYELKSPTDAILILVIVVISATVGFIQEYRSERP